MSFWECLKLDLPYKRFLIRRGWTEVMWNESTAFERTAERYLFNDWIEMRSKMH